MTITDLLADLKGRINPAYAHQLGTESYERRLCVEAMEAQQAEIEQLTLTEEGAKEAYGALVAKKQDLESECSRLRKLLTEAHEIIRCKR